VPIFMYQVAQILYISQVYSFVYIMSLFDELVK